jgi:lycopene cyclase domain-containing protein
MGSCKIFQQGKQVKEYTFLTVLSALIVIRIDRFLKTKLTSDKRFWIFWCIMFIIICIVNGYLTWRPVVIYGNEYYMGIRLFTIPIEDFLFGFSLITSNIIIWEYFSRKE